MAPEVFSSMRVRPMSANARMSFSGQTIKAIPYEDTVQAKPPTTVIVAAPRTIASLGDEKRDSGLEQTISRGGTDSILAMSSDESGLKVMGQQPGEEKPPRTPSIAHSDISTNTSRSRWRIRFGNGDKDSGSSPKPPSSNGNAPTLDSSLDRDFVPLTTSLPDTQFDFINQLSFSTRGSVLLRGKKAVTEKSEPVVKAAPEQVLTPVEPPSAVEPPRAITPPIAVESPTALAAPEQVPAIVEPLSDEESLRPITPPQRSPRRIVGAVPPPRIVESPTTMALSQEAAKESLKVRSMYEEDVVTDWRDGNPINQPETLAEENDVSTDDTFNVQLRPRPQTARATSSKRYSVLKREHELAGGIEDWEDINGGDVDRYGFIVKSPETTRSGSPEPRRPQRVSTSLQLASQTPRKQRGFVRQLVSPQPANPGLLSPGKKGGAKSLRTQNSNASQRSMSRPFRTLTNRLPGNQDRRWMDEAGDMLTLPHGLADITEADEGGVVAEAAKKREWSRSEKWRRMAKVVKSGPGGEGMEFEFDITHPKLIDRTWKGIPDCWRATAWRCFLNASAKKVKGSPTEASLVEAFQRLVVEGSADDVQIDMDVPRTINSHIMFRKRYRGGQRLLFRVLHCLALYFPETGYVQGMASLAATLLCYYDEERTFIMCVRLWTLRGLDKLYAHGFAGLMAALDEFQKDWMRGHDVSLQLDQLDIGPTAYGTRWYLTLFNYSIPFVAQLRVWDVFMLLGDMDLSVSATPERPFRHGLDVIHACSCALIDGTREILLDSDFDNAMKVLTSWVPIKDEGLFMRVARAEWKMHQKRR